MKPENTVLRKAPKNCSSNCAAFALIALPSASDQEPDYGQNHGKRHCASSPSRRQAPAMEITAIGGPRPKSTVRAVPN